MTNLNATPKTMPPTIARVQFRAQDIQQSGWLRGGGTGEQQNSSQSGEERRLSG
jgi:hypothetical protein